jgi:signal transduction histidine kinase/CheY-like chemotaxis protein
MADAGIRHLADAVATVPQDIGGNLGAMQEGHMARSTTNRRQPTATDANPRNGTELKRELAAHKQSLEKAAVERDEALARELATAEVLRVISGSVGDPDAALQAVVDTAWRICKADNARVALRDGDYMVDGPCAGPVDISAAFPAGRRRGPISELPGPLRAMKLKRTVQIRDVWNLARRRQWSPELDDLARRYGGRTALSVPMRRGEEIIGALMLGRHGDAKAFSKAEIRFAETFADQAVIAVENARLFASLQESSHEQAEALEREQATAEVLRIISRSPEDLNASLQAVAKAAARLCKGEDALVWLRDGDYLVAGARARNIHGVFTPGTRSGPISDLNTHPAATSARTGTTLHIVDMRQWAEEHATSPEEQQRMLGILLQKGTNSRLVAPLLSGGDVVGVLVILRTGGPAPFTEREITLAESFADQAAIAVENSRLFQGIQERNLDLTEALERERATAEVLRAISRSPEDLDVALEAVASTAVRLCQADFARTILRDGDDLQLGPRAPKLNIDQVYGDRVSMTSHHGPSGEVVRTGQTVQFEDALRYAEEHGASDDEHARLTGSYEAYGPRGGLATPLLRGTEVIGVLMLARLGAGRPFSDREIHLAETFADQAAIAVENSRLFRGIQDRNRELTEALEQQTATAGVLRIISEAPTDLERVLNSLAENAVRLCRGEIGHILLKEGEQLCPRANFGYVGDHGSLPITNGSMAGAAVISRANVIHSGSAQEYALNYPDAPVQAERGARIAVPLLREGQALGALLVVRSGEEWFSEREAALLQTFADQAVIAVENARLFDELQARTQELEAASGAKSDFLSRMSHELRTPLNAIIGFAEIMAMDATTSSRQQDRVQHILAGGKHLLGLINEVLDIARIESGRLSLSLEPVPLDGVVQEVLDLERPLAEEAGVELTYGEPDTVGVVVQADRQRLRQVVLNLVGNAVKYNRQGGSVMLSVKEASPEGEPRVRLTVADTGPGIEAEQLGRLFEPFERLSADSSGVEGTGLGLAIARGLVEAMGGSIGVESVVGEGSAFWIELPVAAGAAAQYRLPDEAAAQGGEADLQAVETRLTLLYIEDNQPNVDLVQHALEFRPGVELLTAPDGATGVRIARRYRPGLVLLDLNLPDLQGDEVLEKLHEDERTAAIPVVMVSADAMQAQIDRLLAAGAHAYLTKPVQVRRLLAIIDEIAAGTGL